MNQTRKIRWLIAHEPADLFLRTANAFSEKLTELTNGKYEVEIFTASEYANRNSIPRDPQTHQADPMVLLDNGDIELSQLHITELARWHSPDFYALELPFLFRDHDHASKVLEGEIGQTMLNELTDRSPARGLAFTYSGGFRCVASREKIENLDGLKGINFGTNGSPVAVDTVEAVGAVASTFRIRDYKLGLSNEGEAADALDTTIPRYLSQELAIKTGKKYLLNTKHSLFLTSIIVGNEFWNSLDQATKDQFNEACIYASRLERNWSVTEAEEFAKKLDHSDTGTVYSELAEADQEKFKTLVQPLYDKYRHFFRPGLVDRIIQS
jgi:TRAP-type C4-dicarboxylate transport system substrate-binding protein